MAGQIAASRIGLVGNAECVKAEALLPHSKGLDGEGFDQGLGLGGELGDGDIFQGFADLAYYTFAGEGFLEEEGVLEEIVIGSGLFEVASHIDDFEVGEQSFEALG